MLKGTVSEIFASDFFSWIVFSQPPEKNMMVMSNLIFSKIYEVKVHQRWQIMGTISDCLHRNVNLIKEKIYLHYNST